ncbi:MAG: SRPBCC family protein [Nitrospinae bacterium]|nr:SRPBCC family protein [Nitrospinota bacterium]
MTKLHHEIKINAPVKKVWAVLANLENVAKYNPVVAHARYISPNREGVGAARQCEFKPKGSGKERVFEWEPERLLAIELFEHNWPVKTMRWWTRLHAEGNNTRVSQDIEYEMKFSILGKLMNALMMNRKLNQGVAEIFENLKKFTEEN